MKKLIFITIVFAGCYNNQHGVYVNHTEGQYAITDDTLEMRDSLITSHSGFQRIRNGKKWPKPFKTQQLFGLHPQFYGQYLILKNTRYEKI